MNQFLTSFDKLLIIKNIQIQKRYGIYRNINSKIIIL